MRKKSLTNDDPYYELNCVPLKRYFEVLTLGTYECNLIWKWGLCRWNQVKLRSSAWTLNPIWVIVLKETENLEKMWTQEVQLETEVLVPQAQEHLGPLDSGRHEEGSFPRGFWRSKTLLASWFWELWKRAHTSCSESLGVSFSLLWTGQSELRILL